MTARKGAKAERYVDNKRKDDVRLSNIIAAKSLADAVRTSLGPRGMDKMVVEGDGNVLITNDGATILDKLDVKQPAGKMLVQLSKSQDIVAGDGTTSVVVLCGALLKECLSLLERGVHPSVVSDALHMTAEKVDTELKAMATPITLEDRELLIKCATTSLNSKVVSQYSSLLAPIAVDAVLSVVDPARPQNVDLKDIRIVAKQGGTIDDTEMVDGLVFNTRAMKSASGPTHIKNAKIGLIQFCISPPKTDVESNVIVSDYAHMDRVLKEEKNYILQMVKKIRAAGCNVLLIQKSILRDAVTDLSLHYLAKAKIMVVTQISRDDIEFISTTLNCLPIANIESFKAEKLGHAAEVKEASLGGGKVVKVTGIENKGKTMTVLVRGSNQMVLEEADRSLHDALCVIRCLVRKQFLIAGGSAPEMEMSRVLTEWAKTLMGMPSYCVRGFAQALEVIPYTLAENAGLDPISIVTELRNRHSAGHKYDGINVRKGTITDMKEASVLQPLLVTSSAFSLAAETVRMILKIDDIVPVR
jgi:T-complex protein 1 subunit delta